MRWATIAFLCGILLYQQLPDLPFARWAGLFILVSLPLSLWLVPFRFPLWLVNGFLLTHIHAASMVSQPLDVSLQGQDLDLVGEIISLPEQQHRSIRFQLRVIDVLNDGIEPQQVPLILRLDWYNDAPQLLVGERWQLRVRLKRPHGFMNPGGFDYEAWLLRQGIGATGYVRKGDNRRLAVADGAWVDRSRQWISGQINALAGEGEQTAILEALAIGVRANMEDMQWQVLTQTGTSHLVAISGLHIGLVAGAAFFIARRLWQMSARAVSRLPAQQAAAVAAMVAAGVYAALAGFSVPTQRALIMICVLMLGLLLRRNMAVSQGLALALLMVLALDPFAVMDAGFWLSFAAVAAIFYIMGQRIQARGVYWRWGRVHVLLALALAPLTVFWFDQASLISPLANLIAVPWVSLTVVPLVLFALPLMLVSSTLAALLLTLADMSMQLLWLLLVFLAELPAAQLQWAVASPWLMVCSVIGVVVLLAPAGFPGRWLGAVWLAALLLWPVARPEPGSIWFSLLDVGQGLAAVIRTQNHVLVFDAGPRFGSGLDTGEAVVVPVLRRAGLTEVDVLVVSHGDNDHIGGVASLRQQMPVARVLSSVPHKVEDAEPCRTGQRWSWDGVVFEMLYPADASLSGNDGSCVLKVSTGQHSVLLTGDIERRAEARLLASARETLAADVLVVPHHGSLTSSTPAFVAAVEPSYALFPSAYRNRYRLPQPQVVARYQQQGATVLATGWHGAIEMIVTPEAVSAPRLYRAYARRYWHQQPSFEEHWVGPEN